MFELLTAIAALGGLYVEAKTVELAAKAYMEDEPTLDAKKSSLNKEPVPVANPYPNRSLYASGYNHRFANKQVYFTTKKETKEINPLVLWCNNNIDIIIDIMARPGEHLIAKKDLAKVDVDELSTLLFEKLEGVDSITNCEEGLLITIRKEETA